jgi:hypothetical protein
MTDNPNITSWRVTRIMREQFWVKSAATEQEAVAKATGAHSVEVVSESVERADSGDDTCGEEGEVDGK